MQVWTKELHSECKMSLRTGYPEMLCEAQDNGEKICWSWGIREGCQAVMIQAQRSAGPVPAQSPPQLWLGLVLAGLLPHTPSVYIVPPSRNAPLFSMWETPTNLYLAQQPHLPLPSPHTSEASARATLISQGGHLSSCLPPSLDWHLPKGRG